MSPDHCFPPRALAWHGMGGPSRKKAGMGSATSPKGLEGRAPLSDVPQAGYQGRAIGDRRSNATGWRDTGMIDQRDSLAREVDEELRRERLLKLWEQYGTYIIAAVVVIIAGIGVYKYVENRRAQAAEAAGARLASATRETVENKQAEAQKTLEEIAATGPRGYATLARLRLAAALREAGKSHEAASAYEEIARDGGIDPLLADYAQLQATM